MRGNKFFKFIDLILGGQLLLVLSLVNRFIPRRNKGIKQNINKILIIKLSAMGDTVLLLPVIKTLKENFVNSKISFIVTNINKSVAEKCPYIDKILELKVKKHLLNPFNFLKFIKQIRKEKFDLSIDADQWLRISALLSFLSGAKIRSGFKTNGQFKHFTFTNVISHKRNQHELECFFDLINFLNLKKIDKNLEFKVDRSKLIDAENILNSIGIQKNEKFIILHPEVPLHANQRQWPEDNFIKLAEEILKKYNVKILITGTKRTESLIEKITEINREKTKCLTDISIDLLSAVISKSSLLVCNNTGIMHLACAIGIPVIALHGPTDSTKWGPVGERNIIIKSNLPCSPCLYLGFEYGCKTNNCMKTITVKEVLENVDRILKNILILFI